MSAIQYGCQTYTWQMSYEKYSQRLDHIISVVAGSGFAGIEAEICMLGPYNEDPARLAGDLQAKELQLGALCLVCDWLSGQETDEELTEADRVIAMLQAHFPGTLLALCQMPQADRSDLAERQNNCIACCNAIGRRAADSGVATVMHPNSPPGSVFRIAEDYRILMDGLDSSVVGYAPDAGHIAKGGMDPVAICQEYGSVIQHVHFKDMTRDGTWAEMGAGAIDFAAIVSGLEAADFQGWIMVEDESPRAETDPDAVTVANGEYLKDNFI
ncbi:MAG: TIM barrel protein [Phycisphaerae bacterium]|jgi:inosose dehydratase|nr:TIM barrel protein [Phycisphaerae bacterium]